MSNLEKILPLGEMEKAFEAAAIENCEDLHEVLYDFLKTLSASTDLVRTLDFPRIKIVLNFLLSAKKKYVARRNVSSEDAKIERQFLQAAFRGRAQICSDALAFLSSWEESQKPVASEGSFARIANVAGWEGGDEAARTAVDLLVSRLDEINDSPEDINAPVLFDEGLSSLLREKADCLPHEALFKSFMSGFIASRHSGERLHQKERTLCRALRLLAPHTAQYVTDEDSDEIMEATLFDFLDQTIQVSSCRPRFLSDLKAGKDARELFVAWAKAEQAPAGKGLMSKWDAYAKERMEEEGLTVNIGDFIFESACSMMASFAKGEDGRVPEACAELDAFLPFAGRNSDAQTAGKRLGWWINAMREIGAGAGEKARIPLAALRREFLNGTKFVSRSLALNYDETRKNREKAQAVLAALLKEIPSFDERDVDLLRALDSTERGEDVVSGILETNSSLRCMVRPGAWFVRKAVELSRQRQTLENS